MKRMGVLLSLVIVVAMAICPAVYATGNGLEVVSISPSEGQKDLQPANVAIKIAFSENMTSEQVQALNQGMLTILNEDDEEQTYKMLYNAKKYPNEIWVIIEEDLVSNTEYSVTISGELQSSEGNTLGSDYQLNFKTRNTSTDNNLSMLMMVGMMGGMFFFTSIESKRKAKKEAEISGIEEIDLNPYKIKKEKGISLEEAIAYVEKEKQKAAKKRAKLEAELADDEEDEDEEGDEYQYDSGNFKVSRRRPIAEAGGKAPKSVRRQKEEKRRLAEIERRERQLKAKGRKSKK